MQEQHRLNVSVTRLSLILGALAMFAPVGTDMYLAGVLNVANDFHADVAKAQLTFPVFFLGLALGQILYGPLVDRFGRSRPLWIGVSVFVVSSFLIVVTPTINGMIALRLFQALGGCSGMIIGRAVVRDLFDYRQSARIYAMLSVVQGLAPILAPILGAFILTRWGWRATFAGMGVFGLGCLVASVWGLPESLPAEARRKANMRRIGRDYWEMLCYRPFIVPALAGSIAGSFLFAYISASPYVFMGVFGAGKALYTAIFASNMVGTILAAQVNNHLSRKYSPVGMLTGALAFAMVSNVALVAAAGRTPMLVFLVPLWLTISMLPVIFANSVAIAMRTCGDRAGIASALLGLLQFGFASLTSGLASVWRDGTPAPMSWIMLAAIGVGFAIFGVGMRCGVRKKQILYDAENV